MRTADSVIDINGPWTIYVAFKGDATAPGSNRGIIGFANGSTGVPYAYLYLNGSNGALRFSTKDDDGVSGSAPQIDVGSLPVGVTLIEVRSDGSTITMTCLNNDASDTGAMPPGTLTLDNAAIGARYTNGSHSDGWNGGVTLPLLAAAAYDAHITSTTVRDQVEGYITNAAGRNLTLA